MLREQKSTDPSVQFPELPQPAHETGIIALRTRGPGLSPSGLFCLLKAETARRVSRRTHGPLAQNMCVRPRGWPRPVGPRAAIPGHQPGQHSQPKRLFLKKPLPSNISNSPTLPQLGAQVSFDIRVLSRGSFAREQGEISEFSSLLVLRISRSSWKFLFFQ